MARIELKYCTIRMRDGLSGAGTAANTTAPATGDTTLTLGTVALNSLRPGIVPIGARVRVAGETTPIDHVVTVARQRHRCRDGREAVDHRDECHGRHFHACSGAAMRRWRSATMPLPRRSRPP